MFNALGKGRLNSQKNVKRLCSDVPNGRSQHQNRRTRQNHPHRYLRLFAYSKKCYFYSDIRNNCAKNYIKVHFCYIYIRKIMLLTKRLCTDSFCRGTVRARQLFQNYLFLYSFPSPRKYYMLICLRSLTLICFRLKSTRGFAETRFCRPCKNNHPVTLIQNAAGDSICVNICISGPGETVRQN